MTKHTPGKWEVGKHHGRADGLPPHYMISQSGEMYDHAIVFSAEDGGEGKANARLIAAAPAMYEALEYALNNLRKNKNNGLGLAAIQKMKNALALAKGGEPE